MTHIVLDQEALNLVIDEMIATKSLDMVVLDTRQFPCGKVYFEDAKRMFLEDRIKNDVAYIVHNNFLHTKEAKILRFKEVGLWNYDEKRYYTNTSQKYILYDNLNFEHRRTAGM